MLRLKSAPHVLAIFVALMGIINIGSSLFVHNLARSQLIHVLLPIDVTSASRTIAVASGFALLIVAHALWRGKRVAWALTIGLLAASALLHLIKGLDWEEAIVALGLCTLLIAQRHQFTRRSDPPTLRRIPLFIASGLSALFVYALSGFWFLHAFQPFSPMLALQELAAQLVWSDGPYSNIVHGRAAWFLDSLSILSALLLIGGLVLLLRPVLPRAIHKHDRETLETLLQHHATSSLAPFARLEDKQLYFGEHVAGVIAYRLAHRVAVVCGDPIAASEDVGALAREFVAFCANQDWQVCFYEVQPQHLPDYSPLHFNSVKIGEDAWIQLPTFTLKGSRISDIRHAVSKVERDGTTFHVFNPDHDAQLWAQFQQIDAAWRAKQHGIELGFSIGQLPTQPNSHAHYTVALGADRQTVLAFCSFLPIEGIEGYALDLMRRADQCPNGTMEFLIARSLEYWRDQQAQWVSLGLAPLANVDAPTTSLIERALRMVYQHPMINATYGYQRLFFFKNKFAPQWRGGYLLYPHALALPQVLVAVVLVHAPALGSRLFIERLFERRPDRSVSLAKPSNAASS